MESFKYCQLIYKTWLHRFTAESNLDDEYFILTLSRSKSKWMQLELITDQKQQRIYYSEEFLECMLNYYSYQPSEMCMMNRIQSMKL